MAETEYGLLLPTFGPHASVSKIVDGTQRAEEYGFDSVAVRDHLVWHPHGMEEGSDRTHVDTFTALSALSSVTDEMTLCSAVAIPLRHPLHLAHQFASLNWMNGGNTICGLGAGNFKHEFEVVDMPYDKRPQLVRENVDILKKVWNNPEPDYDGEIFSFENAGVFPKPKDDIPIWYGGSSPASVRRAIEFCDGWWPGRINMKTFKAAVDRLESESEKQGRERPSVGAIPITSVDEERETAIEKSNYEGLLESANNREYWLRPDSGEFETVDDLSGVLMAGTPEDVVNEVETFVDNGIDHLFFDLRMRLDEWEYCLDLLGEKVLPEVP